METSTPTTIAAAATLGGHRSRSRRDAAADSAPITMAAPWVLGWWCGSGWTCKPYIRWRWRGSITIIIIIKTADRQHTADQRSRYLDARLEMVAANDRVQP